MNIRLSTGKTAFLCAALLLTAQFVNAQEFSNASLAGCYAGHITGNALVDPIDPSLQLPVGIILRFCADGGGAGGFEAIQNFSGACIADLNGPATYTVLPQGFGEASATLTYFNTRPGCAFVQPPVVDGDMISVGLSFILNGEECLDVVGTSFIVDPGGSASPIPFVVTGRMCKQEEAANF